MIQSLMMNCTKSIAIYDISTLYTKLPHDKLKSKLSSMFVLPLEEVAKVLLDYLIMEQHVE